MTYGINIIIKLVIAAALAILLGNGSVVAFNHFPDKWFEDWNPDYKPESGRFQSDGPGHGKSQNGKEDNHAFSDGANLGTAGTPGHIEDAGNGTGQAVAVARTVLPEKLLEADAAGRQRLPSTPWKYLFVGLFGISGVWLAISAGIGYQVSVLIILWVVLEMAIADWLYQIVPDQLQILLAVTAMGMAPYNEKWWEPLAGAAVGFAISFGVWGLGMLLFRSGSLGGADIKFFICMGFVAGRAGIIVIFVLTTLFFAAYSVLKIAGRRGTIHDINPMLPPAFAATMVYFLMLQDVTGLLNGMLML